MGIKSQRVKESKGQRVKESKGQRVKGSKSQKEAYPNPSLREKGGGKQGRGAPRGKAVCHNSQSASLLSDSGLVKSAAGGSL